MALTATAPNKVQDDIIRVRGIKGCTKLAQSFNRPNLFYEIRPKLKNVLADIAGFIGTQGGVPVVLSTAPPGKSVKSSPGSCVTRTNSEAWHYHAGMPSGDRKKIQEGWQDHKFEIIVATVSRPQPSEPTDVVQVAFGMG
jgi:bloom syndrome protein